MGVTNSNKELNVSEITCGGSFQIRLSLTVAPDITTNPTDVADLKVAVDAPTSDGSTNHEYVFTKALDLFDSVSNRALR